MMQRMNIFTVTLSIVIMITVSLSAQENSGVYDWPIKPGMPEWKELTTHAQMVGVLQIPENILSDISTEDLMQTCLNYPLFLDMFAFNSLQQGIENIISDFNGLRELLKRQDAGVELLKEYTKVAIPDFEGKRPPFQFKTRLAKIEILLAQEAALSNLQDTKRLILLAEAVKKFEAMLDQLDYYDFMNFDPNVYLMGKVIHQEAAAQFNRNLEQDDALKNFMQYGSNASASVINKIVTLARELLTQ